MDKEYIGLIDIKNYTHEEYCLLQEKLFDKGFCWNSYRTILGKKTPFHKPENAKVLVLRYFDGRLTIFWDSSSFKQKLKLEKRNNIILINNKNFDKEIEKLKLNFIASEL